MNIRVNAFANLVETPVFTTKPKGVKPVEKEVIARVAEENKFLSRQAPKPSAPRRKLRRYRTGRNIHLGIKATAETIERFYKAADERNVPSGELLRLALDAFEAIDRLQKIADKREISLKDLVIEAVDAVEAPRDRAGGQAAETACGKIPRA